MVGAHAQAEPRFWIRRGTLSNLFKLDRNYTFMVNWLTILIILPFMNILGIKISTYVMIINLFELEENKNINSEIHTLI